MVGVVKNRGFYGGVRQSLFGIERLFCGTTVQWEAV